MSPVLRGNVPEMNIEELAEILDEFVDLGAVELREGDVLGEEIPVDSKDMLRVLTRRESRYAVKFSPRDLACLRTVGDVLDVVRRQGGMR